MTLRESYEEVNRHGLHFMIDLCGYTKGARSELYALQPAAIQIMYKGFMFSSGAPHMQVRRNCGILLVFYTRICVSMCICMAMVDGDQGVLLLTRMISIL